MDFSDRIWTLLFSSDLFSIDIALALLSSVAFPAVVFPAFGFLGDGYVEGFSFVGSGFDFWQDRFGYLFINLKKGVTRMNINPAHMKAFNASF